MGHMDTKMSRSRQKKEEKRQFILDAARKIFTREGYHNARIEAIAAEAGVGKGTVYEYFSSKQELFQKMLETKYELYRQIFFPIYQKNPSLEEGICEVIKNHSERCIENRELTFLIMQELPSMEGDLKKWFLELNRKRERLFRKYVTKVIHDHIIRDIDMDAFICLISGMMTYLELEIAMKKWDRDLDQTARALTDILLNGIKPNDPSSIRLE